MNPRRAVPTLAGAALVLLASCSVNPDLGPRNVTIEPAGDGFQLRISGNPYFIKGAGGSQHLDALLAAGGNSIRSWNINSDDLNAAARRGLTVLAGIPLLPAEPGSQAAADQIEGVRQIVRRFRDHSALLMWALGNEPELEASGDNRIRLWRFIELVAQAVKEEDPNHPVISVIADADDGKAAEIAEHCPTIDALGVNAYDTAALVPQSLAEQGWQKAYLLTEFGPRADWEVPRTHWGVPLEDDSTVKASHYLTSYDSAVANQPDCLGSYAYFWGDTHRRTQTWYGMFLRDGSPTGAVDAMTYAWTGAWPLNHAPEIGPQGITIAMEGADEDMGRRSFPSGTSLHCAADATDPDGDPLIVRWELRFDTSGEGPRGSEPEAPPPAIEEAVRLAQFYRAVIRLPERPGSYRIFAYVVDSKGSAATVNVPVIVPAPDL